MNQELNNEDHNDNIFHGSSIIQQDIVQTRV